MNEKDNNQTAAADYGRWLRSAHSPAYLRRTAARNAAFFLPHLSPGVRLLDAGCGPGSITLGLAEVIAPGEAIGIDTSGEMIGAARALAAERGTPNVRYEIADLHALPFDDATFDAAFVHAVLQHLPDPAAALREVRRVLKPGGVIGVADADLEGSLIAPSSPALDRSLQLMVDLRRADRGSPHVGRQLRALLGDAGFASNAASVTADADGATETTARTGAFWASLYEASPFIAHVTGLGLATEAELREMAAAWRAWGADRSAFWARFWCQAVGWAPVAVP